ncbi:MAG: hypothetical protein ACE37H_00320 [Phycisphaeraceae bacterium]
MTIMRHVTRTHQALWALCLAIGLTAPAWARPAAAPELNAAGERIRIVYAEQLQTLSAEVAAALPEIDAQKAEAFVKARAALDALRKPGEGAGPKDHAAYEAAKAQAQAQTLAAARAVLEDLDPFLASNALDGKLMRIAILRHGTPAGLAEFAQQSDKHKALIDNLLADETLMKQVLEAGGANGGEYGEAMQVYALILDASDKPREPGILQNLALGTALHQPWLEGQDPGSVNAPVFTDHQTPDGQVARYLHYEKAYLDEELDPAFKHFTAWECRYITNDPYSNKELAWARTMLRNFRPDHVTNPDYSWRYVGMVKSDFPYCSTRHDPSLGMPQQEALALGGICGRRAFFGRFITRAFGIPARRSTQTGHAAMNMWTPDGWVVRLGAWWSMNWCGPWGGLDFLLDSQAREYPADYAKVLRAQWVADALGEDDVSLRHYGKGGGLWNALAFYQKRAIVQDHQAAAIGAELATLTEEEARLLGESDTILTSNTEQEDDQLDIPEQHRKITVDQAGVITVPAVACTAPDNNTDKVLFLDSWEGGFQVHYQRLGTTPEILRYSVEAPRAGKYKLTAHVATVSDKQNAIFRINRRDLVDVMLPYTKGDWQDSEPQTIDLREGRNSIMLTFRAPNRGVSIKSFQLTPVDPAD